jgi:hypothetical protein
MKKNVLIFCILALIISLPGYGQNQEVVVYTHHKRFKVGDMYYASSLKGLQYFMTDLRTDNPDLFEILKPSFSKLQKKRNTALATWISSGVVGTTLVVGAFTFGQVDKTIFKPGDPFYDPNAKEPSLAYLTGGFGVCLVGGLVGLLVYPRDSDIYNFINLHNRNNPQQKMEWEVGFHMHPNLEPGLKLTMKL